MTTHKYIDKICIAFIVIALLISSLYIYGAASGKIRSTDTEESTESVFSRKDLDGDWDTSSAVRITLEGKSGTVEGDGAYFSDGDLIIAKAGRYILSGKLTDGSVIVDAAKKSKVWICLDGAELYCSDSACLYVKKADKVFVTLAEGSVNSMESGETYSEEAQEKGIDGVIFSKDDLTINGSGSLTVNGAYKHGIAVQDDLKITGGSLEITAVSDAIHAKEDIGICEASISMNAEDDAVHSDTKLYIESGTLEILSCYEGLEAVEITIDGGDITIYPDDDGINASSGSSDWMKMFIRPGENGAENSTDDSKDEEDEELSPIVTVNGGNITIINNEAWDADGIDSNGDIIINGGNIFISLTDSGSNNALDYGSESGGVCEINGGTVVACGSSQMAEEISEDSQQGFIYCTTVSSSAGVSADADSEKSAEDGGTELTLTDSDGNVLLQENIPCSFSCVILSTSKIQNGETYQLLIDGSEAAEVTAGESTKGGFGGGGFGGGHGAGPGSGFGGGSGNSGGAAKPGGFGSRDNK